MATKAVRFKRENDTIIRKGYDDLNAKNLTWEKYQALIAQVPSLKDHFEESDPAEKKAEAIEEASSPN